MTTSTARSPLSAIKFLYLRDPKNKERVITVARQVNYSTRQVEFAIAICLPPNPMFGAKGDTFNKTRGRTIAETRLLCPYRANNVFTGSTSLGDTEAPIRSVVKALLEDSRPCVQRAALHFLKNDCLH